MIISDLSYLEVVSEVPTIVGGKRRVNQIKIKAKSKAIATNFGDGGASATSTVDVSVVSSNDNL